MYQKIEITDFRLFKNQTILFGKYLTVLSGRNSTGKSTILGMIANSGELKKKDGVTYTSKAFRGEFSELFKGSKQHDQIGADRFKIVLCDENGRETDYRTFRTAWQTKDKYRRKKASIEEPISTLSKKEVATPQGDRFRVIPFKKLDGGRKTEAKFQYPVLYLGLSRLFPIGESQEGMISPKNVPFKSDEHRKWFIDSYKDVLSMQNDVDDITNYSIGETDKKSGIGVNTDTYDYLTNSSGQDNLGQILLALLSFRKLKEEQGDCWHGGILLIDEIDATLHPAAQSKLIKLFIQEAKNTGLQIVVTTHSLSFLQEICEKTKGNVYSELNNNIELYYLTNANRRLEIIRNPAFSEIENDLTVTSLVQSKNKIRLYTEDAEARWFLRKLVPDYYIYIQELDVNIGCDQLISLYNSDLQYFGNSLIVFDGDVTDAQLSKIPDNIRKNLGNILKLPGNGCNPEQLIYQYILSLDADHDFWRGSTQKLGLTWDYFNEHGPNSDDYKREKERERYKAWFRAHQGIFDSTNLMEFWKRDNPQEVASFQNDFKTAHNKIAARTLSAIID